MGSQQDTVTPKASGNEADNSCGAWQCCPRGFVEHIKNFRYLRSHTGIGFFEYWYWELKSLLGLNTILCFKCQDHLMFGERKCRKHKEPPLTLSQRIVKWLVGKVGVYEERY